MLLDDLYQTVKRPPRVGNAEDLGSRTTLAISNIARVRVEEASSSITRELGPAHSYCTAGILYTVPGARLPERKLNLVFC